MHRIQSSSMVRRAFRLAQYQGGMDLRWNALEIGQEIIDKGHRPQLRQGMGLGTAPFAASLLVAITFSMGNPSAFRLA